MREEEAKAVAKGKGKSKAQQILSGRALFNYNPELFKDDANAGDKDTYDEKDEVVEEKKQSELETVEEEKKESEVKADEDLFAAEAQGLEEEVDFD